MVFDTILDSEHAHLTVKIGDVYVPNLPEFLLPVCGDYLNARSLQSLERLCTGRLARMVHHTALPEEEASVEQYIRVHILEMSLEQRFSNHVYWLQIRRQLDEDSLDDLLAQAATLPATVFTQRVRETLADFAAGYLFRRHQIWGVRDSVDSRDMAMIMRLTHLPPKWAVVFIYGVIAELKPSSTLEADLQSFFHVNELAHLTLGCRVQLTAGEVGPACLSGRAVVPVPPLLLGVTMVKHAVNSTTAAALHTLAMRIWRDDAVDGWLAAVDIEALVARLVNLEYLMRRSVPESCASRGTLEACREDLGRRIKQSNAPRLRALCLSEHQEVIDLLVCTLAHVTHTTASALVQVADVVDEAVDPEDRQGRKRMRTPRIEFTAEDSNGQVLTTTLAREFVWMDASFGEASLDCGLDATCLNLWLTKLTSSAEFLFIRPWRHLALFRLLGRLVSLLASHESRPPHFPLLAPEFLGAALTDSAGWADAFREGLRVGRSQTSPALTLAGLVQAVHGLSGPFVHSGVKVAQFAAQGGLHARLGGPFITVRRHDDHLLTDSVLGLQRHLSDDATAQDLLAVQVRFAGEVGIGRGVMLDWLSKLAERLFSPELGLFERTSSGEFEVNPALRHFTQPALAAEYLRVVGKVVRLAARLRVSLGVALGPVVLKALMGQTIEANDVKLVDAPLSDALETLHLSDPDELDYLGELGEVAVVQTLPYGQRVSEVLPNEAGDLAGYIRVRSLHRLGLLDFDFYRMLTAGFGNEAADGSITDAVLRRRILGTQTLDVAEWRSRTNVVKVGVMTSDTTNLFFRSVEKLDAEGRRNLLAFWTGSVALPPRGFAALPHLTLHIGGQVAKAATCFSQLFIPAVSSETDMDALLVGLTSAGAFTDK